ncbi:conserved membrane hypothetical protein [Syntrophobacter sp. SbD1]|nr:conserved membrane hypothetical protein [Syntrophobacter sp. SbD1]
MTKTDTAVLLFVCIMISGCSMQRTGWSGEEVMWLFAALLALMVCLLYSADRTTLEIAGPSSGLGPAFCLLGIFLCILGSKLHLIGAFGSGVPFWDQWDIAGRLYPAAAQGTLAPSRLFEPYGEHRILFSRLLALTLIEMNGQWDPVVEMVVNAFIYSLIMTGLCLVLWRLSGRAYLPVFCIMIGTIGVLQFSWECVLWGGSTYFLLGFSILSILLLVCSKPLSFSWHLGIVAALLGQFTTATGFIAPAAVALTLIACCLSGSLEFKKSYPALIALVVLAFLVSLLRGPFVDLATHHASFENFDLVGFIAHTTKIAAWPFRAWPFALLVWSPFFILLWKLIRTRPTCTPFMQFLLALGIWSLLQAAAMGFARGASASRYRDIHAIGLMVNIIILFSLAARSKRLSNNASLYRRAVWLGTAVLVACIAMSVTHFKIAALILQRYNLSRLQEVYTAEYILTGDPSYLEDKPCMHIPHPSAEDLIAVLGDPNLRKILPASIRTPLPVEPAESAGFARSAIPPSLAPLPHRIVVGSWRADERSSRAVYVSRAVSSGFGRLVFDVAGGGPGASLEIEPEKGAAIPVPLARQSDGWRQVVVRAPRGTFTLRATDSSDHGWIAFSWPRELANGGYYVRQICSGNLLLTAFGLMSLIAGLAICLREGEIHDRLALI